MATMPTLTVEATEEATQCVFYRKDFLSDYFWYMEEHNPFIARCVLAIAQSSDTEAHRISIIDCGVLIYAALELVMTIPEVDEEMEAGFNHDIKDPVEWMKKALADLVEHDWYLFLLLKEYLEQITFGPIQVRATYCAVIVYKLIEHQLEINELEALPL
jgi:hypothetical protein